MKHPVFPTGMRVLDPRRSIAWHFEDRVRSHPDRIAIETTAGDWTYAALNDAANKVSHWLQGHEVGIGSRVVIWLSDAFAETAGLIGIWKAGAAFVPLDVKAPLEFNHQIIRTVNPDAIVTDETLRLQLAAIEPTVELPLFDWEEISASEGGPDLNLNVPPDTVTRIVFTSGSTGNPKGVEHDQMGMLYRAATSICGSDFQVAEIQLNLSPLAHVTGSTVLLNTLLVGGTLSCYPLRENGIESMGEWIRDKQVTRLATVPTVFRRFMKLASIEDGMLDSLRIIYLGAEGTRWSDVELLKERCAAHTKMRCNMGSTETGPIVGYEVPRNKIDPPEFVPLGTPYPDIDLTLRDERGEKVARGETGEITIVSRNIAVGYFNTQVDPNKKFESDPDDPSLRVFRTGDLARFDENGLLIYAGRRDRQVKIRGHRVELDYVASTLRAHPSIEGAEVRTWRNSAAAEISIAAYITTKNAEVIEIDTLARWLQNRLPGYMLPNSFQQLDSLPITRSGKLDYDALPPPQRNAPEASNAPLSDEETRLLHWWRELLEDPELGVDDNFFLSGGDSLLATRLMVEAEEKLGRKLPLNFLFLSPTPRTFAASTKNQSRSLDNLVPIQEAGTQSPLFFVHGWADSLFQVQPLLRSLRLDRPIYFIQCNEHCGARARPAGIEEMVTQYADLIQNRRGNKSCLLAGFSLGGSFAFAIAAELKRRGLPVEKVIVVDTFPRELPTYIRWRAMAPELRRTVPSRIGHRLKKSPLELPQMILNQWRWRNVLPTEKHVSNATLIAKEEPFVDYYSFIARSYRLPRTAVDVLLLQSEATIADLEYAWSYLSKGRTQLHTLSGTHDEMVKTPHVEALCRKIETCVKNMP